MAPYSRADLCKSSIAQLASGSEIAPIPREAVLKEIASFYLEALQDKALMPLFEISLKQLASIDERSEGALYREIEVLAGASLNQRAVREEREVGRRQEFSALYLSLQPYLDALSDEHREIIEQALLFRGLVDPLSAGEVEFRFQGEHSFLVGDEGPCAHGVGNVKEASFGPGQSFAIGQVPVTQFMYLLAVLGSGEEVDPTPSRFKEGIGAVALQLGSRKFHLKPNHPVERVSALDAEAHARRVSKILGVQYGLPSDLQWEFANRSGSGGKYHFGGDERKMVSYMWFGDHSGQQTQAVGQLLPNGFHLHDTHGNVSEWTSSAHPDGTMRSLRGGSWDDFFEFLRSSRRNYRKPDERASSSIGFRLVRKISDKTHSAHTFELGDPEPKAKSGPAILEVRR
jgi:hypothetical protein